MRVPFHLHCAGDLLLKKMYCSKQRRPKYQVQMCCRTVLCFLCLIPWVFVCYACWSLHAAVVCCAVIQYVNNNKKHLFLVTHILYLHLYLLKLCLHLKQIGKRRSNLSANQDKNNNITITTIAFLSSFRVVQNIIHTLGDGCIDLHVWLHHSNDSQCQSISPRPLGVLVMLASEHEPLRWAQYYVTDRDSEIEVEGFSFSTGNQELLGALLIVPQLMAISLVGRLY